MQNEEWEGADQAEREFIASAQHSNGLLERIRDNAFVEIGRHAETLRRRFWTEDDIHAQVQKVTESLFWKEREALNKKFPAAVNPENEEFMDSVAATLTTAKALRDFVASGRFKHREYTRSGSPGRH